MVESVPDGITYIPNFLDKNLQDLVLVQIDSLPWSNELKRRVQHYGYKYDYTKKSINQNMKVGPIEGWLFNIGIITAMAAKLPDAQFDQLIINEYQPGQGISAHTDCVPCFKETICSISLLSEYPMVFSRGDEKITLNLGIGSLLIMTGEGRYKWKHCIEHKKEDNGIKRGRRISLTYRNVILEDKANND